VNAVMLQTTPRARWSPGILFPRLHRASRLFFSALPIFFCWGVFCWGAAAQERRARPPEEKPGEFSTIFFEDVRSALSAPRPRIDQLRGGPARATTSAATAPPSSSAPAGGEEVAGKWAPLAEPVEIEDEVKRLKLHYDSLVTTPGKFGSGDFQQARTDLALLATFFAVISEFEGEVRFKKDSAIARDLFARSAVRVTTGSAEVFDEAKTRKADLQDLVSGSGLNRAAPSGPTDWSVVTTRGPLMEYLEQLLAEPLQASTVDAASMGAAIEDLKRSASMVAVISEVLSQTGMEGADDDQYRKLSAQMKQAALDLRRALARNDADGARLSVGAISQACSACHDEYR